MCDYNKIFAEIAKYKMIKKAAESELAKLESEIKSYMEAQDITELVGVEHKASISSFDKTSVDSKLLQKMYPSVYAECSSRCKSTRFNFS